MIWALLGALVIGLSLGLFGSGGSILTVPVLLYLLHHEDKAAITESIGIVGVIALVSALPYALGRLVEWRTALLFGLPGMLGTSIGAWVSGFVPGYVQLFVFSAVMLLAAVQMWRRGSSAAPAASQAAAADAGAAQADTEPPAHRSALRIGIDGLGVGALTGFVGVGGGFLIVPALVLLGGLEMRRAVGSSLLIIAMQSATGFLMHLRVLESHDASVDWATIALFIPIGIVGSFAGRAVNARVNQSVLQRGFAVFLVAMAAFILIKESLSLREAGRAHEQPGTQEAHPAPTASPDPTVLPDTTHPDALPAPGRERRGEPS